MQIEQLDSNPFGMSKGETAPKLPSRFQIGDSVKLRFNDAGTVGNCEVIKVHFTEGKVFYDVQVTCHYADLVQEGEPQTYDEETYSARLYNIDSVHVDKP